MFPGDVLRCFSNNTSRIACADRPPFDCSSKIIDRKQQSRRHLVGFRVEGLLIYLDVEIL